jgi:DNA-binding XRE family transcriptional regulator
MKKVGAVLRTIRKNRNLPQWKLAKELGVSQREICFVERGERKHTMTLGRLLKTLRLTEMEIEDLIWASASDFLKGVGLSNLVVEKIKAEHSMMRCYGHRTRIKKILSSFKEGL